MNARRKTLNRRLWSAVRSLPGGEETMRDMVGFLHQEDGTGGDLDGDAFTSTKNLTDQQFRRLVQRVEERSNWPERRRSKTGDVVWLVGQQERKYIEFMAKALGWDGQTLERFVLRQVKRPAVRIHKEASAVIEPMERMLAERGWTLTEKKSRKWWDPPVES